MIYIYKLLKMGTKAVGKVELHPDRICLSSADKMLTKIVEIALSRHTMCKTRKGTTVVKTQCHSPQSHVEARLRAHLHKPYFVSDTPSEVDATEKVHYPLSILEGAEVR
jgi:hypothetical protein